MQKAILITGCSSGIGYDAALALQQRGYRVFATARKDHDVSHLQALGLESLLLDLNDSESIQKALEEILARTNGHLYALFNNAGYQQTGAVEDLSRDTMRAQFETNVFGLMELTNLVIPIMRKQGYGRIIQNTSILSFVAVPYSGAYTASKYALEGFSNTLRQELAGTGITVSMIAPGPISTKLRDNAYQHYQETIKHKASVHTGVYHQMEKTFFKPLKKPIYMAEPKDVVKKLIHALESKHPKFHYYVGMPAHLFVFLKRILPERLLDWILRHSR